MVRRRRRRQCPRDRGGDWSEPAIFWPKTGAAAWFYLWCLPTDAPDTENVYPFIDYLLQPEVIAKCTSFTGDANANKASTAFVDPVVTSDAETICRMYAPKPAPPLIRGDGVLKSFGSFQAVYDVSLTIRKSENFALLGGSGCGKTTLLRMLVGFEDPTAGRIFIDGQDMTGVPSWERPVHIMFQCYALFPHMTVEKNVGYGLKHEKMTGAPVSGPRARDGPWRGPASRCPRRSV